MGYSSDKTRNAALSALRYLDTENLLMLIDQAPDDVIPSGVRELIELDRNRDEEHFEKQFSPDDVELAELAMATGTNARGEDDGNILSGLTVSTGSQQGHQPYTSGTGPRGTLVGGGDIPSEKGFDLGSLDDAFGEGDGAVEVEALNVNMGKNMSGKKLTSKQQKIDEFNRQGDDVGKSVAAGDQQHGNPW